MDGNPASEVAGLRKMVALQARVCYMNVDRTLATWTRTSLALVMLGLVVDRFGLLLRNVPAHVGTRLAPNPISSVGGIALVSLGILIAGAAAIRHQAYRVAWLREYGHDPSFGPWLSVSFAALVVVFGGALLTAWLAFSI